jgi:hypothetical protein
VHITDVIKPFLQQTLDVSTVKRPSLLPSVVLFRDAGLHLLVQQSNKLARLSLKSIFTQSDI